MPLHVDTATVTPSFTTVELVAAVRGGDPGAWEELVRRYGDLVTAVARRHRLQPSDAADAVQNTWLRVIEHLDTLRDPQRLPGWLAAVAARESLAVIRRARREPVADTVSDDPAPEPGPEAQVIVADATRALGRCLERVDGRWRALAGELVADPDRCYQQLSADLGMPVGSIGPTRGRLLRRLRTLLEEAGYRESVV